MSGARAHSLLAGDVGSTLLLPEPGPQRIAMQGQSGFLTTGQLERCVPLLVAGPVLAYDLTGPRRSLLSAAPHLQRGESRQKNPGRRKGGRRATERGQQASRAETSVSAATLGPSAQRTPASTGAGAHVSFAFLACSHFRFRSDLTMRQRLGVDGATVLGRTQSLAGLSPLYRPGDDSASKGGRGAGLAGGAPTLDPMRASAPRPSPDAVAVRRCSRFAAMAGRTVTCTRPSSACASSKGS